MKREIISDKAPAPIGPFSQGIAANGFIFLSGQIGVDPNTGHLISEEVEKQTRIALENMSLILAAAGSSMDKIVKCTVFLKDMEDFHRMNAVYEEFFDSPYPARLAVQAARLPLDARVEIEAIATA